MVYLGMVYKVILEKTEEGYHVWCPVLPGCWSQGDTEGEAIENIQSAIHECLLAVNDQLVGHDVREVQVPAQCPKYRESFTSERRAHWKEGKHIVMSNGRRTVTIPRHDPVNGYTMAGIVRDAGLTEPEFRELL